MSIVSEIFKNKEDMTYLDTASTEAGSNMTDHHGAMRWERPTEGIVMINCDAAWSASSRQGGVGVIARDKDGCMVGGWHDKVAGGLVEEIEANVVLHGVRLAVAKG